jgi:hypothetical protein
MNEQPDVDIGSVDIFSWFKPFSRAMDSVDKAIGVVSENVEDKDLQNRLIAELQNGQQEIRKQEIQLKALAEQSYVAELNTKTTPWADSIHKLARTGLSVLSMVVGGGILIYYISKGNTLDLETMLAVFGINSPALGYNIVKGKGNPVKP